MALIEIHLPAIPPGVTDITHFGPVSSGTMLVLMLSYHRDVKTDETWGWLGRGDLRQTLSTVTRPILAINGPIGETMFSDRS